jgi:HEAT repeat protein
MSSTGAAIQVIDLVRALAMAWKNLAAYPRTHPAVVASLESAERRLAELRGPAGEVTLGVARESLIYGALTVDSVAAQKLAQALYTRGVAILRFGGETTGDELEVFLRLLAGGTAGAERRAIWEELTAAGVMNINLQPVSYDGVQLSDDLNEMPARESAEPLWLEVLKALLEGRQVSDRATATGAIASVDELSRLLTEYVDSVEGVPSKFDPDATFGVRLPTREERMGIICSFIESTFGERMRGAPLIGLQHSLEQAVQLLGSLAAPLRSIVLAGILRALAGADESGATMREFLAELPNDDVLEALRYLSSMGDLSPHAALLLRSLSAAEPRAPRKPAAPAAAALADLVLLFGEDDADRFNPEDHHDLLATVAVTIPAINAVPASGIEELGASRETVLSAAVLRQLRTVLMDLLASLAPDQSFEGVPERLGQLIRRHFEAGEYDEGIGLLAELQELSAASTHEGLKAAVDEMILILGGGDSIAELLESLHQSSPESLPALQRMVTTLGTPAFQQLFGALAEEGTLSRRRRLFDFIASLGPAVVPLATSLLGDPRWYVVRNMITLLRVIQDRTSLPQIRKLGGHPDIRVRMEAIRTLAALEGTVPKHVLDGLFANTDPKLAAGAVGLVGTYRMKEGIDPLLRILSQKDILGGARTIRIKALRALAEIGDPRALPKLESFFRSPWLPWPAREERLAAWESLALYPPEARKGIVEKGLKARDGDVRAICARLARD